MNKKMIICALALLFLAIPVYAQKRVQRGIVRMITRSAADPIVPVAGVQVVVDNEACKKSDDNGRFSLNVAVNMEGSYSLADVRIPKDSKLVWVSPQKNKKLFLSKGDLDVAVATKEEKDAEYRKRYNILQQQYKSQVKRLKTLRDEKEEALLELQETDAKYAQIEAERDSIQKVFTNYIASKGKIDKVIEEIAEELSMVDYQSLDTLERHIYELKCAGEWKSINDLVRETMGGDAMQAFNRIKEKEKAATAMIEKKKLELADAMSEERAVAIERERWFSMMEANILSFKAQHLNDSASYYFQILTKVMPSNCKVLNQAGLFEIDYRSDFSKAMNYFNMSLECAGTDSLKALTYNNIGYLYNATGEYEKAVDVLNKAMEYLGENQDYDDDVINNLASAYLSLRQYKKSLDYNFEALKIRQKQNSKNTYISYNNIGSVYEAIGDIKNALKFYLKSLELLEDNPNAESTDLVTCFINVGEAYCDIGDWENASIYLKKALNLACKIYDVEHPSFAKIHELAGNICELAGDLENAMGAYEESLHIKEKVWNKNVREMCKIHLSIGGVYQSLGDSLNTFQHYQEALNIASDKANKTMIGVCYSRIGGAYATWENYSKALDFFDKSRCLIKEEFGDRSHYIIDIYSDMGTVYLQMMYNDYAIDNDSALIYFDKAESLAIELYGDNDPNVAFIYIKKGDCFMVKNNNNTALENYEKGINILKQYSDKYPLELASTYNNAGYLYGANGDIKKDIQYLEKSLNLTKSVSDEDSPDLINLYYRIGNAYLALNDKEKGLTFIQKGLDIAQKFYGEDNEEVKQVRLTIEELNK